MTLLCQICLTELAESQENYCAVCEPLVDLCEWPLTREEERELMQNCCQAWQERAVKAEAELQSFVLCEYCRENGKVHVAVSGDQMVDADHVWALVNGADVYHKEGG